MVGKPVFSGDRVIGEITKAYVEKGIKKIP
jgi:hypothetical protein